MSASRAGRSHRSLTFTSVLLLSTALAAPAFAQIEEVVVTAQKRAEDIQTVPIAISAFTSQDLAARQIKGFDDLQFNMPSVTVTNGTFGSSNFEIRGIGSGAVTTSGDAGVSINQNDVYIDAAGVAVTSGNYFDIQTIEVDRGPQGTLYGQNATGGAVNVITNKPDLENFGSDIEGTYGNYDERQVKAEVNIPIITDELALRLAGFWENRGGDISNIYGSLNPGSGIPSKMDTRDDYALRGSLRWEPTSKTTVDLLFSTSKEDDSRVRTVAQSCTTDPSGVLGCLPEGRTFQNINLDSTSAYTLTSDISPFGGTPYQLFQVSGGPTGTATPSNAGSTDIIPGNLRTVNMDFQPIDKGQDNFGSLTWKQKIFPWLDSTFIAAFDNFTGFAEQETVGTPGPDFSLFPATAIQQGTWHAITGNFFPAGTNNVQAFEDIFDVASPISGATYYPASKNGLLPISAPVAYGLSSGNIMDYSNHMQSFDDIGGDNIEKSLELRFASSFQGPFNFLIGLSHLETSNSTQYYVGNTGYDLASVVFGSALAGDGVLAGPSIYNNNNILYQSRSSSAFGEVYYDIIPDTLKFTAGLRWSEDDKTNENQQVTLGCFWPIGTSAATISGILASGCQASPLNPYGPTGYAPLFQKTEFDATTGRGVLQWTPKLDFTDQTMVYASYSHGNRPGGFNPPSFIPGLIPNTFAPENLDAYELGTKNTLLNGTLQADFDVWYYNYEGYQYSSIVNRSSLNVNLNSTLYGLEGEMIWAPDSHWAFDLNFGLTHSALGNDALVDTRNPTQGNPDAMDLKDYQGSNCIIQTLNGVIPSVALLNAQAAALGEGPPLLSPATPLPTSVDPTGGAFINGSASGIYGLSCSTIGGLLAAINAHIPGADYLVNLTENPTTHVITPNAPGGIAVSVKGNQMPNTPPVDISVGAQYTFDMPGGYGVVPRVDYYWKSQMYSTVFNTAEDKILAWGELNAQIQLNAPDSAWYARLWVKNALASNNITGSYTGADAQGLFTNLFLEDPRTFGITVGAHF